MNDLRLGILAFATYGRVDTDNWKWLYFPVDSICFFIDAMTAAVRKSGDSPRAEEITQCSLLILSSTLPGAANPYPHFACLPFARTSVYYTVRRERTEPRFAGRVRVWAGPHAASRSVVSALARLRNAMT